MQNEKAVSPVIGVILMVAITVILAAVIAAFVFEMAGPIIEKRDNSIIEVQWMDSTHVGAMFSNGTPILVDKPIDKEISINRCYNITTWEPINCNMV